MAEETAHLAPHGVPSNPLPRGLSSNKLQDLATENHGYGATHTSGSNLNIPQGIQKIAFKNRVYQIVIRSGVNYGRSVLFRTNDVC